MNRQERRRLRKLRETENRNLDYLEDRQVQRMDTLLGLYAVAIGIAHHNLYGCSRDEYIEPLIREWNSTIARISQDGISYDDLRKELSDTTGIEFVFQ